MTPFEMFFLISAVCIAAISVVLSQLLAGKMGKLALLFASVLVAWVLTALLLPRLFPELPGGQSAISMISFLAAAAVLLVRGIIAFVKRPKTNG